MQAPSCATENGLWTKAAIPPPKRDFASRSSKPLMAPTTTDGLTTPRVDLERLQAIGGGHNQAGKKVRKVVRSPTRISGSLAARREVE
jgi:hypothetical protein